MLNSREAADYLGVSNMTIHRWRKSGRPRIKYRLIGGRAYYEEQDLEEYLEGVVIEPEEVSPKSNPSHER